MKVIEVSARKGGVGTSTVAVSLAVALAKANPQSVLLVDTSTNADTWAIAGVSPSQPYSTLGDHDLAFYKTTVEGLAGLPSFLEREFVIIDAGTSSRSEYFAVVCVHNEDFVLNRGDVKSVLNAPLVHYFGVDNSVARAIDAGLYGDSRSNLFAEWTSEFLRDHGLATPITA